MMVTAIGSPARYFRGMAMKRRTMNEIPSAKATFLNQEKTGVVESGLFMIFFNN
jgi:hypothetical protein